MRPITICSDLRLRLPASSCLGHAKPTRCVRVMSVPSGQRWEKASEPRIGYGSNRNKFRLKLLYIPKKQKTQVKRSPFYTTREKAEANASWWRLSWEHGHKGENVYPFNDPDRQPSPKSESAASATALPRGKSDKKFVSARLISTHFGER